MGVILGLCIMDEVVSHMSRPTDHIYHFCSPSIINFSVLQITVHYQERDFYEKPSPRTLTVRILLIFLQLQQVKFSNRTALPIHCVITYPEHEACRESHSTKTFTGEQWKFYNALTIIRLIAV